MDGSPKVLSILKFPLPNSLVEDCMVSKSCKGVYGKL